MTCKKAHHRHLGYDPLKSCINPRYTFSVTEIWITLRQVELVVTIDVLDGGDEVISDYNRESYILSLNYHYH